MHELDVYYFNKSEPNRGCLLALRQLILAHDEAISETRKWGMPCFCYKNKPCCYLWTAKKTDEPYLLMVEGKHLKHPALEIGNRSKMKILSVNPNKDLPIDVITLILDEALALYKSGKIKTK